MLWKPIFSMTFLMNDTIKKAYEQNSLNLQLFIYQNTANGFVRLTAADFLNVSLRDTFHVWKSGKSLGSGGGDRRLFALSFSLSKFSPFVATLFKGGLHITLLRAFKAAGVVT